MTDSELASVLRAWRDRIGPDDVGLPRGGARRAAGLRREELASLAGLSVDYIVRLEQGRSENPSPQVLASLSRALRLSREERDHLYRVAGILVPLDSRVPTHVPASVQRLLDRLGDIPVSVCTIDWTLLTWNPLWAALLGDPSAIQNRDRNIAWRHFTAAGPVIIRTAEEIDEFEFSMVADLRAAVGRYPRDEDLASLISDLRKISVSFATLWGRADVAVRRSEHKMIDNPVVGAITLDCDVLTVPDSDLRIVAYTAAPGSVDAEKLDVLRVAGLQSFAF